MSNSGTHRSARRHRASRIGRALAAAASLALIGAAGAVGFRLITGEGLPEIVTGGPCQPQRIRLVVDPKIAATVTEATSDLSPWLDDDCVRVAVTAQDSATTAEEVARAEGHGFSSRPDLWLPDSTTWLNLASDTKAGAARIVGDATTVATSPSVIALRSDTAETLGWPDEEPTWEQLLALPEDDIRLAASELDRQAAGIASVAALTEGSGGALEDVANRVTLPLLGARTPAQLAADDQADAVPASEQEVLSANQAAGDRVLVAAYDPALGAALDYPLVRIDNSGGEDTDALDTAYDAVSEALRAEATADLLQQAGFRTPAGELAQMYDEREGVQGDAKLSSAKEPSGETIRSTAKEWNTAGRRARLLVLVDRSGSMAELVPGTVESRATLAQASLTELVQGAAPDSDIGLWTFTTGLGTTDYAELIPTGPMDQPVTGEDTPRRGALLAAIPGLDPVPDGATPLYDSVLAAFRSAQGGFAYGRFNAVVVVTDGRNEDPGSISLPTLLDTLRLEFDGIKPVRIVTIAYGEQADVATLRLIADTTGGRSYQALTSDEVSEAFTKALADL